MSDNKPMKGLHVMVNDRLIEFLQDALYDLVPTAINNDETAYTDELNDQNPEQVLRNLEKKGWTRVDDRFGKKVYRAMPYPASTPPRPEDEIRVTIVLNKGALKIDMRCWGEY